MAVSESQFRTNYHSDMMKNIAIGGISGDAFLAATSNAVSEINVVCLNINSSRERS
jgi:hypothetical protein